jgi:hypothetical protein
MPTASGECSRVHENDPARRELGREPRSGFYAAIDHRRRNADWRGPLARIIGMKGYHPQRFADGSDPVAGGPGWARAGGCHCESYLAWNFEDTTPESRHGASRKRFGPFWKSAFLRTDSGLVPIVIKRMEFRRPMGTMPRENRVAGVR